ncbi:MAG: GGDEF domain-containing protein [Clostridia bacterium]|nr:GGDEF domain-containing protein [Clostridia bacterium]
MKLFRNILLCAAALAFIAGCNGIDIKEFQQPKGTAKIIRTTSFHPSAENPAECGEPIVSSPALIAAQNGTAAVDSVAVADEWGNLYSAYCPVMTSDGRVGGIVGVDFDANWYEGLVAESTFDILLAAAFSLLVGGGIALLMTARLRRRFDRLHEETQSIASDITTLLDEMHAESGYDVIAPEAGLLDGVEHEQKPNTRDDPDGIEKLSREVKAIRLNLQRYIAYVHAQAFSDAMTGVGSKSAYLQVVHEISERLKHESVLFSVIVCDVNGLKTVNDEYGHEEGDRLLIGTAACLRAVYGAKNVFRIGGDEFIAVLPDMREEEVLISFASLDQEIARYNAELPPEAQFSVSFSRGTATFRRGLDKEYREVFRRADKQLYVDKAEYYKKKGGRRADD